MTGVAKSFNPSKVQLKVYSALIAVERNNQFQSL